MKIKTRSIIFIFKCEIPSTQLEINDISHNTNHVSCINFRGNEAQR